MSRRTRKTIVGKWAENREQREQDQACRELGRQLQWEWRMMVRAQGAADLMRAELPDTAHAA